MKKTTRYIALLTTLLLSLTAAAQQNHNITCKVMPDNVREAILTAGVNVTVLSLYEAAEEGRHGEVFAGFSVGDDHQVSVPTGKQIVISYPLGGVWKLEKWYANGQPLGGTVQEYKGKNKLGEYDNFYYETPYTMPDTDVEIELWLYYEPTLPDDPGGNMHTLSFVTNAGNNMTFSCSYPQNGSYQSQGWNDEDCYHAPTGELVGLKVDCKTGWRPRRVEMDGTVVYEGDGMYGEPYVTDDGLQGNYYTYYYVFNMPDHDATLYIYGEFRPDDPDHEGDNDLPRMPGSNGWDPETGEVTITNLVTYDDTYDKYYSSITDCLGALMQREHISAADIKSLVMACDMTPEGWKEAYEQLNYLFTSTLPTDNLERIDLSRSWDWGIPNFAYYETSTFKDGTPVDEGTIRRLFGNAYNSRNAQSLHHLLLPASVTGIVGNEAFMHIQNLQSLTLFSTTPPKVDDDTLDPLPLSLTLYVPGPSVGAYKSHPYWSRFFDIRPIDERQVTDVTIYLPSDYSDGRYVDMAITLRNADSGETLKYVVDDRSDYTFRNLPRGARFDAALVTARDVTIATADSIYAYQRYVQTGFGKMTPLHDLTLAVRAFNDDVTENCGITWTTDDGTQLGTGPTLRWQPAGTTVEYDVKLSAALSTLFFKPPHTPLTVGAVPDMITINLQQPTTTVVDGQVTDDSGRRVSGALVTFTLPINDNVSRTYNTVTDGSGNFSLEAVQGTGVLCVSNSRHITWSDNMTLPLADPQATRIVLTEITGPVVRYEMPFTASAVEGTEAAVTPAYNDMDNVDIEVYNVTTGVTLDKVSVQYPQIVLIEGAKGGDQLRLTATSRKGDFKSVTTTTTLNSEGKGNATLALTALGGLSLNMEQTDNTAVTTNIYDADGNLYDSFAMSNADITLEGMPDGEYTVTMMTATGLFGRMSRMSQYAELGLNEGTDYVKQKATVKSGVIKRVSFPTVPVLDETRFYYIDIQNTEFYANKSETGLGTNFSLRASITLKPEYEGRVTAAQLVVDLPTATAIVPGSAMTGQRVVQFTEQDNRITIPIAVADLGEVTRFAVQTLGDGEKRSTAWMLLTVDGQQVRQPLGNAYIRINGMGIDVPEVAAELTVPITGFAPPQSLITILADDFEIGHTMAGIDGFWNVDCQLPENTPNLARFSVKAKWKTPSGATAYTPARDLSYDRNAIIPEHVYMYCSSPRVISGKCIDFDFTTSARKEETIWLWLHMYETYTWNFYTKLNTTDTTRVESVNLIVRLESGQVVLLPSTYDPNTGMWFSNTDELNSKDEYRGGNTPVSVAVDLNVKNMEYDVDADLMLTTLNTLPYMQETLQETLQLSEDYIARITFENDPERLDQLLNEFNEIFNIDPNIELLPEWQNLSWEEYLVKLDELANNTGFTPEGFLSMSMNDLQMDGITLEEATGLTGEELEEAGYKKVPTTDEGKDIYILDSETALVVVDFVNNLKITYDLTKEYNVDGRNLISRLRGKSMEENLAEMNEKFTTFKWVQELIQNACQWLVEGMKIEENIQMCDNALKIYEDAKKAGRMVVEAQKNIDRVNGNKAFWEGLQNWLKSLKEDGPNVSTALTAFTKGEGPLAKTMKFVMGGVKVIEKAMSWVALICDITDGISKIQGLIDVKKQVPNPCKDDYANAERIRNDIIAYGAWTSGLYAVAIAGDVLAMFQVNGGLGNAVSTGGASLAFSVLGCALVIAKTIGMEMYGKDYKQRIKNWEHEIYLLECDRKKPDYDPEHPYWKRRIEELQKYNQSVTVVHDPSGFVYEAVTDNRVQGATASIYYEGDVVDIYGDTHKEPIFWDAENYGQVNPMITDADGRYNWDVPKGLWQVKIEKNGYETAYSEWLPVPPPQLDVNIGIRQLAQPTVKRAVAYEDGIEVEFSKYMRPNTITGASVWLTADGKLLQSHPWPLNTSTAWDSDSSYVSRILVHPYDNLKAGDKVTLTVRREVESYAGVQMANDFQQEFVVTSRVRQIATDSLIEVPVGGERQFRVIAYPATAAAGKRLVAAIQHDFMATVTEKVTFDEKGVALLTLHGLTGGSCSITLTLDEDEAVSTSAIVSVLDPNAIRVAAPMASRISGTGVLPGDLLELWCDTEGATIWYTTDGSCPCDENGTRMEYFEPIVLDPPVTIRAYAVKGEQPESRVVEFTYGLWSGINRTATDAPAVEGYYDIEGRRLNRPQRGVNIVRMTDGTTRKVVLK